MRLEKDPAHPGDPGASVGDVAQEAIDATATTYTNDAGTDVEEQLRAELSSRGIQADEEWLAEISHAIRSGHHVALGEPDGSVERPA